MAAKILKFIKVGKSELFQKILHKFVQVDVSKWEFTYNQFVRN